nr:hypothetical protein [uncultured Rhodopila sp.]
MENHVIAHVYGATDPDQVKHELGTIWEVLKDNPELVEEADIDPATIESEENPFSASRAAEGSAIVAGIVIAAGGRIAGEILIRLWDQVVWPRLQTKISGIRDEPPEN